jgi:hypothetical protein
MRGIHVATLAAVALLLGSVASAQGLGEVAAQEKEKRQASGVTEPRVYTEGDLGPSVAPVAVPQSLPAPGEETPTADDSPGTGDEGEAPSEAPSEDEEKAQAEAAWRKNLDRARQEEQVYQEVIDKLQLELNDMSGGVYNPGRASKIAFLEENQQLLAEVQQRVVDLEAEGRRNGYR